MIETIYMSYYDFEKLNACDIYMHRFLLKPQITIWNIYCFFISFFNNYPYYTMVETTLKILLKMFELFNELV